MEAYRSFLWTAMPFMLLFIGIVFAVIIVLKILLHIRDKKLTSKPQDTSRYEDLLKLDEEKRTNDGNGSNTVYFRD